MKEYRPDPVSIIMKVWNAQAHVRLCLKTLLQHTDDPFESVSYTHLRAHETVLDLVCRLLLEKKKNQQQHLKKNETLEIIQTHTPT